MNFNELLLLAKTGEQTAVERLLTMYRPLLLKESIINGVLDEDLYQELCIVFLRCIRHSIYKHAKRQDRVYDSAVVSFISCENLP